jgi:hypothetical protein
MMAAYFTFTTTRATEPDPITLAAAIRNATTDATAVLSRLVDGTWRGKKTNAWTPSDISAVQNALDTAPALTPQRAAQTEIDNWPITMKAFALAVLDEVNVLRTEINTLRAAVSPPLTPPLPARTPAQLLAAIRNKAGTL